MKRSRKIRKLGKLKHGRNFWYYLSNSTWREMHRRDSMLRSLYR